MKRFFATIAAIVALFVAFPTPRGEAAPQVLEPSVGQLEVKLNPKLIKIFQNWGISFPEWSFVCTATQVSRGVVLSASHCIIDDTFSVYAGYVGPNYERDTYARHKIIFSRALQWSMPSLVKAMSDYQPSPDMPKDTTCDKWGFCYTEYPVVVGYRIGFPRGILTNLKYRNLDVKFAGFRLTDDPFYPQKSLVVKTDPSDPLYQSDVSVLTLASNERHNETYPSMFGLKLSDMPKPGEMVSSVGFSLGLRQWAGNAYVNRLTYLDGYGWVIALRSPTNEWGPGASGSVVWNDKREIVGILTLGAPPDMLLNFTGLVPPGLVKMALEKAGV